MDYELLNRNLRRISRGVDCEVTILANASALIYNALENLNWCGFYLFIDGCLKLGPFQGRPACTKIAVGSGVCGTAVKENRTILVPNVHEFPGHIACDSASNSEIVVPIHIKNQIYAVLDIDSPVLCRFDSKDEAGLELIAHSIEEKIKNIKEGSFE